MMNGPGGDLFASSDAKTGQLAGLNASGWAPAGLTIDVLKADGHTYMPSAGIHTVTVPGAVAGWAALRERFGRKSFVELLSAAIRHAEDGIPVAEFSAASWAQNESTLASDLESAKTYLPGGRPPRVGEIFRNPDLAWTYRQIAQSGREAFYAGEIGKRLLADSARHGGKMSAADLAEFSAEWTAPISTIYRGWTVHELPPNGQGIAAR